MDNSNKSGYFSVMNTEDKIIVVSALGGFILPMLWGVTIYQVGKIVVREWKRHNSD